MILYFLQPLETAYIPFFMASFQLQRQSQPWPGESLQCITLTLVFLLLLNFKDRSDYISLYESKSCYGKGACLTQ